MRDFLIIISCAVLASLMALGHFHASEANCKTCSQPVGAAGGGGGGGGPCETCVNNDPCEPDFGSAPTAEFAQGVYEGNGSTLNVNFPFQPEVIFVQEIDCVGGSELAWYKIGAMPANTTCPMDNSGAASTVCRTTTDATFLTNGFSVANILNNVGTFYAYEAWAGPTIHHGTYTGDASATQAVTTASGEDGCAEQLIWVAVGVHQASGDTAGLCFRGLSFSGSGLEVDGIDECIDMAGDGELYDGIRSLDGAPDPGFTAGVLRNNSGTTYYWFGVDIREMNFREGIYLGNQPNTSSTPQAVPVSLDSMEAVHIVNPEPNGWCSDWKVAGLTDCDTQSADCSGDAGHCSMSFTKQTDVAAGIKLAGLSSSFEANNTGGGPGQRPQCNDSALTQRNFYWAWGPQQGTQTPSPTPTNTPTSTPTNTPTATPTPIDTPVAGALYDWAPFFNTIWDLNEDGTGNRVNQTGTICQVTHGTACDLTNAEDIDDPEALEGSVSYKAWAMTVGRWLKVTTDADAEDILVGSGGIGYSAGCFWQPNAGAYLTDSSYNVGWFGDSDNKFRGSTNVFNDTITCTSEGGGSVTATATYTDLNTWQALACVYDEADADLRAYSNGVKVGEDLTAGSSVTQSTTADFCQNSLNGDCANRYSVSTADRALFDYCWSIQYDLSDAQVCRICSCGAGDGTDTGFGCVCNSADPTLYDDSGLNSTQCGSCTLPDCNAKPPGVP